MNDIDTMVQDRNAALLSLDLTKINAFNAKYGAPILEDNEMGWHIIHKARTAITSMPKEDKDLSKAWLAARGYKHMDI